MARLIDDIRVAGKIGMPWWVPPHMEQAWARDCVRTVRMLREATHELPVLRLDNVADYIYMGTDQERWDLSKDFPNLAPPFEAFWAEYHIPRYIKSKECGDTDLRQWITKGRVGALVFALDPKECQGENIPLDAKWILWAELFVDYGRSRDVPCEGPHGSMFLCVDSNGAIAAPPSMQAYVSHTDENAKTMRDYMTWLNPIFLAISFLHCKNVRVEDERMPAPLAKKFRQRHGIQPMAYKTLVIEPLKAILRTQGRSGEVGLAKAMHICRGHFRDYREGPGLFGKYHQLVWTPQTIRGTRGEQAPPREILVKV